MGRWFVILAVTLFSLPASAQSLFKDNPLLPAPQNQLPYYSVGLLSHSLDYAKLWCAAIPLASDIVLTNAHCLYDRKNKRWMDQKFYFPSTSIQGGQSIKAKSYIIPDEYIDAVTASDDIKRYVFDFGVVVLDGQLDKTSSSTFTMDYTPEYPETESDPDIPPYPIPSPSDAASGNFPPPPRETDDYRMIAGYIDLSDIGVPATLHASFCPVVTYSQRDQYDTKHLLYAYRCSSVAGMSGSPILFKESDNHYKVIGINRGQFEDKSFNDGVVLNYEKFLRIKRWIDNRAAHPERDKSTSFDKNP